MKNLGLWGYPAPESRNVNPPSCSTKSFATLFGLDGQLPQELLVSTPGVHLSHSAEFYVVSGVLENLADRKRTGRYNTAGVLLQATGHPSKQVTGAPFLIIDLKDRHTVRKVAVCGWPREVAEVTSQFHRPAGGWVLEATNDDSDASSWNCVGAFTFTDWATGACMDFPVVLDVDPGAAYRYYRSVTFAIYPCVPA